MDRAGSERGGECAGACARALPVWSCNVIWRTDAGLRGAGVATGYLRGEAWTSGTRDHTGSSLSAATLLDHIALRAKRDARLTDGLGRECAHVCLHWHLTSTSPMCLTLVLMLACPQRTQSKICHQLLSSVDMASATGGGARADAWLGRWLYESARANSVLKVSAELLSFSGDELIWFLIPAVYISAGFAMRFAAAVWSSQTAADVPNALSGALPMICLEEIGCNVFGTLGVCCSVECVIKLVVRRVRPEYAKQSACYVLPGEQV